MNNFAFLQIDNLNVDATINSNCNDGSINITNNTVGAIQHQWNMGDGTIYNTPNVSHNYIPSQSYVITYESISGNFINQNLIAFEKTQLETKHPS